MKNGKAFHYEMEPALLARKWELDDLTSELRKTNQLLQEMESASSVLLAEMSKIQNDWVNSQALSVNLDVTHMQTTQKYLQDLSARYLKQKEEISRLEEEHDVLKGKIALSKKSLEILEEHKIKMKKMFIKSFDDIQLKMQDDQWNVLRPYREGR